MPIAQGREAETGIRAGNAASYREGETITPRVEPQPANDVMHEEGGMTDAANEGGN